MAFHHEKSSKDYVGRAVDISTGGLLMYVPATAPLGAGDMIRLTKGNSDASTTPGLGERPRLARVVRVDRHAMLTIGQVAVGVSFNGEHYASE